MNAMEKWIKDRNMISFHKRRNTNGKNKDDCVCTLVHVLHTCSMLLTELKKKKNKKPLHFYPTRQKNI